MGNTQKKRILWLSDSPTTNTGFGVVTKNLIDNICSIMGDTIEIDLIAINFNSKVPVVYNKQVTLYDGKTDGDTFDSFCRSFFLNVLKHTDSPYDGIFILQDLAVIVMMIPILKKIKLEFIKTNKKSFKSIAYVPVDGHPHKWTTVGFDFFDQLITYTDWGKSQIVESAPELLKLIKVVPHGCNFKDFFNIPKDEIKSFREDFFGVNSDKFIFVNVNRNQPRKGIVDTILSFEEAKNNWDIKDKKPFLYLNMGRKDPMGHDLDLVMAQTSLVEGEDYMLAPDTFFGENKWGVETDVLNKIYNSCDVFITTTLGEGWGLSVSEAMAVRLPVICPYHTSLVEISGNGTRAYVLKNLYPSFCSPNENILREQVEIGETSEIMIKSAHETLRGSNKKMIDLAQQFVQKLDWRTISKSFVNYFNETY